MSHEKPIRGRIELALGSDNSFSSLRSLAKELLDEGRRQEDVLRQFEEYRTILQDAHDEAGEEIVLDVMDLISGWCSPEARLAKETSNT
ncbi:MAG: hypothetical protein IT428_21190 [Planctomycetaceae bacterium]|nr:hypothetical protein [Planctomycetaceae bacterium]